MVDCVLSTSKSPCISFEVFNVIQDLNIVLLTCALTSGSVLLIICYMFQVVVLYPGYFKFVFVETEK